MALFTHILSHNSGHLTLTIQNSIKKLRYFDLVWFLPLLERDEYSSSLLVRFLLR